MRGPRRPDENMDDNLNIGRMEQLETRVMRAVEFISELKEEKKTLQTQKKELEKKIEELIKSNKELSEKINDLKLLHEKSSKSFDKEEVRRKIDHMLEKFGELQL